MNACRSAAGQARAGLWLGRPPGARCGLAGVVAMRFNVYVPTAAAFVGALYGALGAGRELQDAVTGARRLLTERPDRAGLPSCATGASPRCIRRQRSGASADAAAVPRRYARPASRRLPHGFVGRDGSVEIEAALVRHGHVLLRAVAGAGKTAAATEFARWYARTGGCGVAGPRVSLADAPPADALRGPLADRPLLLWDDARALTGEHRALLAEIAAAGGRVLVIADRPVELPDVPLVTLEPAWRRGPGWRSPWRATPVP